MLSATIFLSLVLLTTEAFVVQREFHNAGKATFLQMFATSSSGEATGEIKMALKKMRGVSVSVEYKPPPTLELTSMEHEILSQELRRTKAASIWTSDLTAVEEFSKEQSTGKGSFPGPVSIVYTGSDSGDVATAVEKGANGIVVDADKIGNDCNVGVDVICKVSSADDVRTAIGSGFDYAFLLQGSTDDEELKSILEEIPKSSVVVASLLSMQDESEEIARGKELSQLKSDGSGTKISALVIDEACVGDAEDLRYTAFVVESINKKSSNTFALTGLTGAANGHFDSNISGGNAKSKWRRKEQQ